MKKLSILGLVLMAASSLTAFILPKKTEAKPAVKDLFQGTCVQGVGTVSCFINPAGVSCLTSTGGNATGHVGFTTFTPGNTAACSI